ncbi:MAG: sigma-70 family RNA polymerase sigma factor [Aggregatilineales bacterium]
MQEQEANLSPPDDRTLAREAQTHPAAFAELYRRHADRIFRYVMARVGNIQDAQDITAQVFLDALKSLPNYNARWTFAAWITGIAHNKVVDFYRKRRIVLPLEHAASKAHPDLPPDEIVFRRLRLSQVREGMTHLGAERAEVIALRIFGGLSTAETAQIMNKSDSAVKMLLYRALRDLRAYLGED